MGKGMLGKWVSAYVNTQVHMLQKKREEVNQP